MKQTSRIYLRVWQNVKRYLQGYNGTDRRQVGTLGARVLRRTIK